MDHDATSTTHTTPLAEGASQTGASSRPSDDRARDAEPRVAEQSSTLINDAGQIDVAQILAEVEALASLASRAAEPATDLSTTAGLSALEREIEALLNGGSSSSATTPISMPSAPAPIAPARSEPSEPITLNASEGVNEFQELLDALDPPVTPTNAVVDEVAVTKIAVAPTQAFEELSLDPMVREIDEFLAEGFEAQFARADGDVNRVLQSVFDPRALAGQEEDVNRALIEAFGSSRIDPELWGTAAITNPSPRFDGVVRAVPPEVPRHELDRAAKEAELNAAAERVVAAVPSPVATPPRKFEEIAAESMARKPADYAGESPFVPAFPVVSTPEPDVRTTVIPAAAATPPVLATATTALEGAAINAPVMATTPVVATTVAATVAATAVTNAATMAATPIAVNSVSNASPSEPVVPTNTTPAAIVAKGPSFMARMFSTITTACVRTTRVVATAPLRVLSFPMNILPDSARSLVSAAAVTMVLWVPVAWWFAQKAAQQPGVGPVVLVERAPTPAAEDASHGGKTEAGHPEKPAEAAPAAAHGAAH